MIKNLDNLRSNGIELNSIYNCDCLDAMRLMKDKCVDLVLTDPPYGIGMDNQKIRTKPNRPNTHGRGGELQYAEADWDKNPIGKEYFDEIFRISKYQIIWGANYYSSYMPNGFGWLYWDKQMGDNNFSSGEFAYQSYFKKSSAFSFPSMRVKGTRSHPTQKPEELMRWCIQQAKYHDIPQTILDPFLGSGTTAVACKQLNRNFIGIEISPEYCKIAEERLKNLQQTLI